MNRWVFFSLGQLIVMYNSAATTLSDWKKISGSCVLQSRKTPSDWLHLHCHIYIYMQKIRNLRASKPEENHRIRVTAPSDQKLCHRDIDFEIFSCHARWIVVVSYHFVSFDLKPFSFFHLQTLLKTTNKLLSGDLHSSLSHLKNQSNHGMTPKSSRCCICHRLYTDDTASGQRDDLLIYRWGSELGVSHSSLKLYLFLKTM